MPGFIDVKAFTAEDGERLTVVWWENEETLKVWREAARHRVAQHTGRERWYEYYKMDVAEIVRSKNFTRASHIS
jgi:heme-degrading monooxygenase HmoA